MTRFPSSGRRRSTVLAVAAIYAAWYRGIRGIRARGLGKVSFRGIGSCRAYACTIKSPSIWMHTVVSVVWESWKGTGEAIILLSFDLLLYMLCYSITLRCDLQNFALHFVKSVGDGSDLYVKFNKDCFHFYLDADQHVISGNLIKGFD